jgi:hypothetical protein
LRPGDQHAFRVEAGLGEGHEDDWLYHCHVSDHFEAGMWGLLRVYPYAMQVDGPLEELTVQLTDDGQGLEGASFEARWRAEQGPASGADAGEGEPVDVEVTELGGGAYRVEPGIDRSRGGQLVLEAERGQGSSLARLDLSATGYELVRGVGPEPGEAAAVPSTSLLP